MASRAGRTQSIASTDAVFVHLRYCCAAVIDPFDSLPADRASRVSRASPPGSHSRSRSTCPMPRRRPFVVSSTNWNRRTSSFILSLGPEGPGPQGTLRFVSATPGARFVRITVDTALPDRELAALIGHELQHAVEVARARAVQDQPSFAALYRAVGQVIDLASRHYDTAEARLGGTAGVHRNGPSAPAAHSCAVGRTTLAL